MIADGPTAHQVVPRRLVDGDATDPPDADPRHVLYLSPDVGAHDPVDLGWRLGATLYVPLSRPALERDLQRCGARDIRSVILCLEDSIDRQGLPAAVANLRALVRPEHGVTRPGPVLFIRPRNCDQLSELSDVLESPAISGVVIPKYCSESAAAWFGPILAANRTRSERLFVMPVLEAQALVNECDRGPWLRDCHASILAHASLVCAVRIGLVDLAGHLGIRRPPDVSAYEVGPLNSVIAGILGEFLASEEGPVVCGGVYEHLPAATWAPDGRGKSARGSYVARTPPSLQERAFLREVRSDRLHGLVGKSIIHPGQAAVVNAAQVVSYEEWSDARSVLAHDGARRSTSGGRMNEAGPHRRWAQRTLTRARHWGVLREGVDWEDLLRQETVASALPC